MECLNQTRKSCCFTVEKLQLRESYSIIISSRTWASGVCFRLPPKCRLLFFIVPDRKEEEPPQAVLQHHAAPGREPQGVEEDHRGRGEEQGAGQAAAAAAGQPVGRPPHLAVGRHPGHPGGGGGGGATVAAGGRRVQGRVGGDEEATIRYCLSPPETDIRRHKQLTDAHKTHFAVPYRLTHT